MGPGGARRVLFIASVSGAAVCAMLLAVSTVAQVRVIVPAAATVGRSRYVEAGIGEGCGWLREEMGPAPGGVFGVYWTWRPFRVRLWEFRVTQTLAWVRANTVWVSLWVPAVVLGLPAAGIWGIGRIRSRAVGAGGAAGRCRECGYDLAGLNPGPDGGIDCPECGWRGDGGTGGR